MSSNKHDTITPKLQNNIATQPLNDLREKGKGVRVIMAGGGTGGHIFPAVAIANAIKQLVPNADILFVGARGKMEMEKVPQAGYKIVGLDIAGFQRGSIVKNLSLPFKLFKSFTQVRQILKDFKPTVVVGVGGYSSFPVLRQAQLKGIATFIHESNSFAGKSNKMLAEKAVKVFVAADGMDKFFPASKIMFTGNPVRKSIADSNITRLEACHFFQLDPNKMIVLVVGGSLGARSINEAIASNLQSLEEEELQLIWQTGKNNASVYREKAAQFKGVWTGEFIAKMEMAYAAADIVVSRAGAMAVTELAVAGKPVIFIPYPHAAEDHQTANAMWLVNKEAAIKIDDKQAQQQLVPAVISLAKDTFRQNRLIQNIKGQAVVNADYTIAQEILKHHQKL